MKYIETLREGMRISEVYLCKNKQISLTKSGKEYGNLVLQDKTGTIDSKIWDLNSPGVSYFETMDYVHVDADVTVFQGSNQLNVKRIRRADEGEYSPADYLPVSAKNIGEMYGELVEYVKSIKNPYLNQLASSFFIEDQKFIKEFRIHSAAKSVHHGFVGGLLEHTLGVVKLCDYFAGFYAGLNRDLLIAAAMFHDIGKMQELSVFPENDYTDDGQLLGHIVMGSQMVAERAAKIADFPHGLLVQVQHCILAHHGKYEFGSPKIPALVEALALNYADDTDAKLETFKEILENNKDNAGWFGYNRLFESNLRATRELE